MHRNESPVWIALDVIRVVGNLRFQAMVLLLMAGTDPAVGRDPEPLSFDWGILLNLWNPCYFSGQGKPSMSILNLSISWRVRNKKATFQPKSRTEM